MGIDFELRKKHLHKRAGKSAILIGIISLGVLAVFIRYYWVGPRCTTCFFHFNIDYRLGNEEAEDTIIREPYHKLLKMYEKHPNWKFTVECQAAMIERIYERSTYKDIAKRTTKLVERGQMELICGIQYSQLFYMYPADVLELNLQYAKDTLDDVDLLDYRSNCILFQEGQFAYGLGTLLNTKASGNIDTVLVSNQQIYDFQDDGYKGARYPVYELENKETDETIKLLQYDYLPQWEAGYLHSWSFLLDAELGFEDDDPKKEFEVDDNKIDAYEQEMLMLELEGNNFMTCSEWVKHCEKVKAVGKIDYYIPECNWGTTKYNSSYIWAANNGDSTDDGEMLANNYRCRQIILATNIIYDAYIGSLTDGNQSIIERKITSAELLWLQATCTDSTGIGPDSIERRTGEGNVLEAEEKCAEVLEIIAQSVPEMNVSQIQVDLETNSIYNNTSDFIKLVNITDTSYELDDIPEFDIDIDSIVDGDDELDPSVVVSKLEYNSTNSDDEEFDLWRLDITFRGSHDWNNDSVSLISIKFEFDSDKDSFREIIYSPSLLEDETKRLWRNSYQSHPVYIFLTLSNGMLFIPDDYTGKRGIAIVKNVTQRHTSWLWEYDYVKVLEDEGLHMDAHHQFYILDNVTLDRAHKFANRINVSPPWIVSQNVSLIQGNEVYDMYKQMENKATDDDEGSGEWW